MNPGLIKTYEASGAVPGNCIVQAGPVEGTVVAASGSAGSFLGVSGQLAAADGAAVEIVHSGIVDVQLGASVSFGDWITSDDLGCAVKAAPGQGETCEVIGKALETGSSGDIIRMLMTITLIKG